MIPKAGNLVNRGEAERSANWNRRRADLVDWTAKTLQHSPSLQSEHSNPGNRPDSAPAKFPNPTSFSQPNPLNTTTSVIPSCCCHRAQSTASNPTVKMAAFIKAINAKIRSNKYTDYICSTRT